MAVLSLVVLLLVLSKSPTTIVCGSAVNLSYVTPKSSIDSSITVQDEDIFLCAQQGNCGQMRVKKHKRCKRNPNSCKNISRHHACCFHRICVNLSTNKFHCGSCGNICKHGTKCCNGACVDIKGNRHHCGKCRNACSPDESCVYGICGYA